MEREVKMWYDETYTRHKANKPLSETELSAHLDEAKICWESDCANYNIKNSKNKSDFQWMKTVMSNGTMSDRIAAYVVATQRSPVYGAAHLTKLVDAVKVGKKSECVTAMEHATSLFLEYLLPPNRKLIPINVRPFNQLDEFTSGNGFARKKYLACWYFEDVLKQTYGTFIRALQSVAKDGVDANKEKALTCLCALLAGNPEQESLLLSSVVNKLGDPSRKVASKATYCLGQLLDAHPAMRGVVALEIEKLLFRPNLAQRAQYYALCFLAQFCLEHEDGGSDVARKLIDVYFSFFRACVKKGEVNSRMMSVLLMGVNRAYPYAELSADKMAVHVDTMYRIVHIANFNIGLHALALLFQVSSASESLGDRFYSALYRKLLDPAVSNTTHQAMLLSLVYKALLRDTKPERVRTIIKRLLQNALHATPAVSCGILFLVSRVIIRNKHLSGLVYNPSDEQPESVTLRIDHYDPNVRNPLYAGGRFLAYEELVALSNHFHPTVTLYAEQLLAGTKINYSGDPLKDFGTMRFLERFTNKNPKKFEVGTSSGSHPVFGKRKRYVPRGVRSLAVGSAKYAGTKESAIPVEELFLHSHSQMKWSERKRDGKENQEEDDVDSVNSDEFEEMLDRMATVKETDEDDIDYMNEVEENIRQANKNKKKSGKKNLEEDDDNSDDEQETDFIGQDNDSLSELSEDIPSGEDDEQDLEMNEEDRRLIGFSDDEDQGSDIVFDSEDEDVQKGKNTQKKKKKGRLADLPTFATPEELAALLEREGASKIAPGGSDAWQNADKADAQQIDWEGKRNRWVEGYQGGKKRKWKEAGNAKNFSKKGRFNKDSKHNNKNQKNDKKRRKGKK